MRVNSRLWKGLGVALVLLTVCEGALTIGAFARMTRHPGLPSDVAAQRLLLSNWLVRPLLPVNPRNKPYTGGRQRYLGDLTADSLEWIELIAPDALLGFRLGRNLTASENIGLGAEEGFVWVTNDEGFASLGDRDFHYGLAHPARGFRIVIVGGSTVFGTGAGIPERSLPARIHSSLARDGSHFSEVINAGVPGYDSGQEFLYVASELIHYKPDLLIVYDGWNDESTAELDPPSPQAHGGVANLFKSSEHLLIEERFAASYSVLGSAQLFAGTVATRTGAAIRHTGTYWLMRGLARRILPNAGLDQPARKAKYDPAPVRRYEENLTNILNLADHSGMSVALFLQPIMFIDDRAPTAAEDSQYIAVRRAFYADARPMFARLRERYQRPAHVCIEDLSHMLGDATDASYVDSGHLNGRGNQIMADEIVRRLAACSVLKN